MTDDVAQRAAIAHQVRYGEEALRAARALRDLALFNDSLSRLYYAVFHYALALLLTEGVEPRRHRALPDLLSARFQPSGTLSASDVVIVARMATYRDMADYGRSWQASREVVDGSFAEAEPLLLRFRELLAEGGWLSSSGEQSS